MADLTATELSALMSRLEVYRVSECDYVLAESAGHALLFMKEFTLLKQTLLEAPVLVDLNKEVWFELPEEAEERESRSVSEVVKERDPSYDLPLISTLIDLVTEHLNNGFTVPAIIYCDRHFQKEFEIPVTI